MGWLRTPDEDPHGIRIAVPTSREWLAFKNRALAAMAHGVIHAGNVVDIAGARWVGFHDRNMVLRGGLVAHRIQSYARSCLRAVRFTDASKSGNSCVQAAPDGVAEIAG